MTEFPVERRNLLRTIGASAVGGSLASQSVTGQIGSEGGTSDGELVWDEPFETGDEVESSPTVLNGILYVGSRDNSVYAIDADSGNEQWSFETGDGIRTSPQVIDDTVFIGSNDNNVYALNSNTGEQDWQFETEGSIRSIIVANETVYAGSVYDHVYALNATNGNEQWKFKTDKSPRGLTVVDETVFFSTHPTGASTGYTYALEAETGTEQWSFSHTWPGYSLTVANETVFVGSDDDRLYALDINDGSIKWDYYTGEVIRITPTVYDDTVYFTSYDERIHAVDIEDGSKQWDFKTNGQSRSSATVAEGTVFVGNRDNHLYALDADSGEQQWSFETDGTIRSSPTVVNGVVYVGSNDNNVYALEAGVSGSSEGTRINLGTLGHHHEWAGTDPGDPSPPETGIVEGNITDEDANPLSDVEIEFVDTDTGETEATTTTDEDGEYDIELQVGTYDVIVDDPDYELFETTVTVEEDQTHTVDIGLTSEDAAVTVSAVEAGPDSLLIGPDIDIVFAVGVEEENGSLDQVEISRTDVTASAENIEQLSNETLCEYADLLGYNGIPDSADCSDLSGSLDLIPFFEATLDLPADQIYAGVIPSEDTNLANGDNTFIITAVDQEGHESTSGVSLPAYLPSDRLSTFDKDPDGPVVDLHKEMIFLERDYSFGDELMPSNLPVDLDIEILQINYSHEGEGQLDLNTQELMASDASAAGLNVFGSALGAEFQTGTSWSGGTDEFTYTLELLDMWFAGIVTKIPGPTLELELPENDFIETIGVDLDVVPSGYVLAGNELDPTQQVSGDGQSAAAGMLPAPGEAGDVGPQAEFPAPDTAEFNTYFTLTASAGIPLAEAFIDGDLHIASDIGFEEVFQPPMARPLAHQGGKVCLDGGISLGWGPIEFEFSIDTIADTTPGFETPCASLGEVRDPPCWEVFDVDGPCNEYPSAGVPSTPRFTITDVGPRLASPTGTNPPADALTAETDAATVTRLSDRPERDEHPDVIAREDDHLAVWERHPDDEPAADSRDIVAAERDSQGDWSDPTPLTDELAGSHHEPAVAAADGDTAVAWTRYDPDDVERLEEVGPMTAIEFTTEDGDDWADPTVIAETDEWYDHDPVLEPLGDDWLLAWERTDDTETAHRALAYAVVTDDGDVLRSETVDNASNLALTSTADAVSLTYHDRATHEIRRDIVTADDRTLDETYAVDADRRVRSLAVSDGAMVWTVTDQTTATGFYAQDGNAEELDFVEEIPSIRSLVLWETAVGTALAYTRDPNDDVRTRTFAYRLRVDGEWRPEQIPASADGDVKLRRVAVAPGPDADGLLALLTGKVHDPDAIADLFAVEQSFRPTYAVSADSDQGFVQPGGELTIPYTIENTGDLDGDVLGDDPVPVEARSQGETLAETDESPLDQGETATGELTVTLDETGSVEIVAGRELDLLNPAERRTVVTGSTPLLAPESVDVERPNEGEATATVTIRNSGPVDAEDFTIELFAGDGTHLGTAELAGPAATEQSSATLTYDPAVLTPAQGEQLHIDSAGELPDAHVPQRVSSVLLGRPDLTIPEKATYVETGEELTATLEVANEGPVPTTVQVQAVWADATPEDGQFADEDVLGTALVNLPAAVDTEGQTEQIEMVLDGVEDGDELRFVFDPERPVADAGIPVIYDTVTPGLPAIVDDQPPQDINGDGLFEDIDGDGEFDIFDVQALFNHLDSDAVQNHPEAFNFNEDEDPDDVTIFDVQGLFNRLAQWDE